MVIDFGKAQLPPVELRLGNQELSEVEVVKVLRILLQANLKWNEQVQWWRHGGGGGGGRGQMPPLWL